jgi:hypothetical protein
MIISRKTRNVSLILLALVLSPQVWYVFSYFNGDGFAFFIAFLIALQLIYSESLTSQYLSSNNLFDKWYGGALFGILLGLIPLLKMNYYLYIPFILLIIVLNYIFERKDVLLEKNRLRKKKLGFIACVALCISLPPLVYDQYINDFRKNEKIYNFVEKHAMQEFRPSTIKNAPDDSYPGLNLRSKGVSLQEMFLENSYWRKLSYFSFFGLYSYMCLYADSSYYYILSMVLAGIILFIYFYAAYTISFKDGIILCLTLMFLLLAIGQSVYISWTSDFEPQGRYLFPAIPILMIGLSRLPVIFQNRTIPCLNVILFVLSLSSFVYYALLYIPKIG